MIDPFLSRFFGIITGQLVDKVGINIGVNGKEKQGQSVKRDAARAQDTFRGRREFRTFWDLPFFRGTEDLRGKCGDYLGKGRFYRLGRYCLRQVFHGFGNRGWPSDFGRTDYGIFLGNFRAAHGIFRPNFRNHAGGLLRRPRLRNRGTGI
jgi:hypothetical protein